MPQEPAHLEFYFRLLPGCLRGLSGLVERRTRVFLRFGRLILCFLRELLDWVVHKFPFVPNSMFVNPGK